LALRALASFLGHGRQVVLCFPGRCDHNVNVDNVGSSHRDDKADPEACELHSLVEAEVDREWNSEAVVRQNSHIGYYFLSAKRAHCPLLNAMNCIEQRKDRQVRH